MKRRVLVIYTGGTIGMWSDPRSGALMPMDLALLEEQVPELLRVEAEISTASFEVPKDSSDMGPSDWLRIAGMIADNYEAHDGFVVLHGSDTMAYTASALSFLLQGLGKPVILTGSQLPVGMIRTDARENLVTAIEIASARDEAGKVMVPEVAIYFDARLMRGNRTLKVHSEHFGAFRSPNWPLLAKAGITIRYDERAILPGPVVPFAPQLDLDVNVGIVHLYPGISARWVEACLSIPELKAVVLHTFGAGNGPTDAALLDVLREACHRGLIMLNITQCAGGRVRQGRYVTSRAFAERGVIGGADMTLEAGLTKLMVLLARHRGHNGVSGAATDLVAQEAAVPICGEMTLDRT